MSNVVPRGLLGRTMLRALACATVLVGFGWADQLVMKNGDRITGTLVKQDGKTITIKTANFGTVAAPWDQVASVQSDQAVTVVLKDGKTFEGPLSTKEGKVQVAATGAGVELLPGDIAAIRNADERQAYERLLAPGLLQLWSGLLSMGWAGTAGNAKTQTFTASANAARKTNTDATSVYFNAIEASAFVNGVTANTAQAVRGGIAYNHNVNPRLFVNGFNDYEYDKFQSLALRVDVGGGFGYHAVKGERGSLDLAGGADYDRSHFSAPLTRTSAEAFWGDVYSLKLNSNSLLTQSFRMFNRVSDSAGTRVNADVAISTKLRRWLSWNVSLSDRYLSDPVPGRKTNDLLYSAGLGVSFNK